MADLGKVKAFFKSEGLELADDQAKVVMEANEHGKSMSDAELAEVSGGVQLPEFMQSAISKIKANPVAAAAIGLNAALLIGGGIGMKLAHSKGSSTGWEEGYSKGFSTGEEKGYSKGFSTGKEKGYESGANMAIKNVTAGILNESENQNAANES